MEVYLLSDHFSRLYTWSDDHVSSVKSLTSWNVGTKFTGILMNGL